MDKYSEPKIITYPGMSVRVYRPELEPEERTRRMQQIYKAAAALLAERK